MFIGQLPKIQFALWIINDYEATGRETLTVGIYDASYIGFETSL